MLSLKQYGETIECYHTCRGPFDIKRWLNEKGASGVKVGVEY